MQAVSRVSVVQQAVDQIKDYIINNNLEVGQKLPTEKAFCEQLQIGRGSLREALRVLASTGYISLEPGRGTFVMRTDSMQQDDDVTNWFNTHEVQMNEYLEVRSVFEPLAAKLAISRCTEEDYQKLAKIHAQFIKAVDENDFDKILQEESNFHNTIIQMSGNELLINIFKLLQQPMMNFRYRSLSLPGAPHDAVKPHELILRAFELRDPEYGEVCMRNHVALGIQNLNLFMENQKRNYSA